MNGGDRVIKVRLTAKELDALEYIKTVYGGTGFSNEQIAKNIILTHVSLALKDIQEKLRNKGRAELDDRNTRAVSSEDRGAGNVPASQVAGQADDLSDQAGNSETNKPGQ